MRYELCSNLGWNIGWISSALEADSGTFHFKPQPYFLYELYNSLCSSPYTVWHTAVLEVDSTIHKLAYKIEDTLLLLSPLVFRTIYLKHLTL